MDIKVVQSQNEIYHKQKLLGQGAFGKAYLVRRKADNELLVIKQMSIEHMSQQQKKQTIKQAQILKNLNHPNIVRFVQVYATRHNKLKIVMQYAECGDLSKAITDRKKNKKYFQQNWILDWITQICLAIKHVHDRKILHRDIKGQNIFITKANTLKLGDFGIARVLNKTMQKARTVVGTPYYLSPQIIENKPYSFQSDIWSIGVVLYELCALTHPFTATSLQFLALKIVKGSFAAIPNQYSKELKSLVSTMLSLDPNKRPTINQIFKNPLIQDRIKNFLTQTKRDHEFSHTILHNHKVQMLTNRLVQIKQQKDFQKQRQKLKEQEQFIKQKLQQKKGQQKYKFQQQQRQKQRQKLKQMQRQRARSIQKQKLKQKQKQEQNRRELCQRQRQKKQFQRKQSVFEEQRKKQDQQKKMQKQYVQNNKMVKFYEQKRKEQQQMQRLRQQHAEVMYRQSQRQQQSKKAQKIKKIHQKEVQQQKKKRQLQQFGRKQFFQNQEIMKRAKQRAEQQQKEDNTYEPVQNFRQAEQRIPEYESRNTSQNFHYQNKRNQPHKSTSEINRNIKSNSISNKNTSKVKYKKEQLISKQIDQVKKNAPVNPKFQGKQELQKKHFSVRQQMKKDRQIFARNKGSQNTPMQDYDSKKQAQKDETTIRAAKWQRPTSRGSQCQQDKDTQTQQKQQEQETGQNPYEKSYDFMQQKVSPNDEQNFNQYLVELQNILQNLNKNVEEMQINNKISPQKRNVEQIFAQTQQHQQVKFDLERNVEVPKVESVLADMPEEDQIIYRDDDQNTFELSLTADFKNENSTKSNLLPQIQASTDLDYFSNFSKLQTLRMNLQDKFGTDNFVQLYRFLQNQMEQKGLEGFTNVKSVVEEASKKFQIDKNILMDSFTLLLTLIHMEQKMMSNH